MSDKAILSDIATARQAGRITRANSVTKRRQGLTMRRVIRADLDLARRPACRPRGGRSCAAPAARASQADHRENPGNPSLSAAGADPRLGAGERKGRGGRSPVLPPAPGLALLDAFLRARSARRRRAARPPGAAERRGLAPRSCASTPTKARCATCASPSATSSGLRRSSCRSGATLAGRPPSLDPGRIVDAAARLDLACRTRTASHRSLKACAGEGDPVSAAAKAAALAFSAFPDAPAAEAEIFALWIVRHRHRPPAALAAARCR